MGKQQKRKKSHLKKEVISKSKLQKQQIEEKRAETEITKHNPFKFSAKNSLKPGKINDIFQIDFDFPSNSFLFNEKFNFKVRLTLAGKFRSGETYFYKLYYVSHQSQRFILNYGKKKLKRELKIKKTFQFSPKYPPSPLIHFELELYSNNILVKTFSSEEIIVDMSDAEQKIKIHEISFFSSVLIPENPFVFWIHASSYPLPEAVSLSVHFQLLDHRLLLSEASFPLKIGGPNADHNLVAKYPFQVVIPAMENKDKRLKIKVEILDSQKQSVLFSQKESLPMEISLTGLKIEHVGYKRDIPLGEIAYMLGDIVNKTPYEIKGRAKFIFFTTSGDNVLCFDRKFKIPEKQYEKLSEDVPLLEFLGGKQYWVHCLIKIKANGISYRLESISEPRFAVISKMPSFFAKLRANLPKEPLKINQIIPVGIDTRIRAENEFNPVYCEIYENYENIRNRKLFRFKIKNFEADRSKFHWKIPAQYGKYVLQVRFWYKYTKIDSANIESNKLEFTIFP